MIHGDDITLPMYWTQQVIQARIGQSSECSAVGDAVGTAEVSSLAPLWLTTPFAWTRFASPKYVSGSMQQTGDFADAVS